MHKCTTTKTKALSKQVQSHHGEVCLCSSISGTWYDYEVFYYNAMIEKVWDPICFGWNGTEVNTNDLHDRWSLRALSLLDSSAVVSLPECQSWFGMWDSYPSINQSSTQSIIMHWPEWFWNSSFMKSTVPHFQISFQNRRTTLAAVRPGTTNKQPKMKNPTASSTNVCPCVSAFVYCWP